MITARAITVTAATNTKTYDGTTSAAATPDDHLRHASRPATRPASPRPIDTKNVGTGKTLTPAGSVIDGNGGANYAVTFVQRHDRCDHRPGDHGHRRHRHQGLRRHDQRSRRSRRSPRARLAPGDTAAFTQTFDTANVGTGKTLTPPGTVNDGNGGANYAVTFVNDTTGVDHRPGDHGHRDHRHQGLRRHDELGGDSRPSPPARSPAGDTAAFTQTFDTKNVGTGKTLTPAGHRHRRQRRQQLRGHLRQRHHRCDHRPGHHRHRRHRTPRSTTARRAPPAIPTITSGSLVGTTRRAFTQTYRHRERRDRQDADPGRLGDDGNGGANYAITFVNNTTGVISRGR